MSVGSTHNTASAAFICKLALTVPGLIEILDETTLDVHDERCAANVHEPSTNGSFGLRWRLKV